MILKHRYKVKMSLYLHNAKKNFPYPTPDITQAYPQFIIF